MANTFETTFSKYRNTLFMTTPQNAPAQKELNRENKTTGAVNIKPEKEKSSKNILTGTLSGLAVLGGSIYWVKSRGGFRGKNFSTIAGNSGGLSNNPDVLLEEVTKLKKLILQDYLSKRQSIINKMNDPGEFGFEIHFVSNQDLRKKVNIIEEQLGPAVENAERVLKENQRIIMDKLRKLSSDPEWNELKILRKKLVRIVKTSPSQDQRKIAENKIPMVNDLLTNKVYPDEVEDYKRIYGIDDRTIYNLVKKEFNTLEEFINEYSSLNQDSVFNLPFMDRRFSHESRLSFETLFPEETQNIKTCKSLIDLSRARLLAAKQLYADFNKKIKELGMQYRTTESIQDLKKYNARIRALRNND